MKNVPKIVWLIVPVLPPRSECRRHPGGWPGAFFYHGKICQHTPVFIFSTQMSTNHTCCVAFFAVFILFWQAMKSLSTVGVQRDFNITRLFTVNINTVENQYIFSQTALFVHAILFSRWRGDFYLHGTELIQILSR